jgi:hypothetical protein
MVSASNGYGVTVPAELVLAPWPLEHTRCSTLSDGHGVTVLHHTVVVVMVMVMVTVTVIVMVMVLQCCYTPEVG